MTATFRFRVAILDLDSKLMRQGHGLTARFPNLAAGKIWGYHRQRGDEVIYPWHGEPVDRLYVSTIFSWTRPAIERLLPTWRSRAREVIIGGTGWSVTSRLPAEMEAVSAKWIYAMYDLDYGIGFTTRGCHVGCPYCLVPAKEGNREYRVAAIGDLVNPRSRHIVLMNNNSLASPAFFEDIAEIRERRLSVNWNQANDVTLLEAQHAQALAQVDFRNFNRTARMLHFAWDQMVRRRRDPVSGRVVEYDMFKIVPEKVRLLGEYGIKPHQLTFYMLVGYDTSLAEDLARKEVLVDQLGCHVYGMLYRDPKGRVGVDGRGNPQSPHSRPFRDWLNGHAFRNVRFAEFDRYVRARERYNQNAIGQQAPVGLPTGACLPGRGGQAY